MSRRETMEKKARRRAILLAILGSLAPAAHAAPIRVVTTLPDLAWAAREIGGSRVEARALLRPGQNAHFADAVPEYIRLAAGADVVCAVGLDLETGWLPRVLQRSGNAKVQAGGAGFCELGAAVEALEKPGGPVTRALGDVHPRGNPHFWLSPRAFARATAAIRDALTRVDPAGAASYADAHAALVRRLEAVADRACRSLAPRLAGRTAPVVVEYHRDFVYLLNDCGIRSFGSLEEKPGIRPSAGRLAEVARGAKAAGVALILGADHYPRATYERAAELSGIPLELVSTLSPVDGDYVAHHESIIAAIARHLPAPGAK